MATRSDLLPRLSMIPSEELLGLLGDDALFDLAAKCLPSAESSPTTNGESSTSVDAPSLTTLPEQTSPKPKRPLNAFMAFRSLSSLSNLLIRANRLLLGYYTRIFPDVQQKAVSGFLTTLWNKDPCRNRWAMIAKVYSFIRDEAKSGKISLAEFLTVCCPIMKIIEPSKYLSSLGWTVRHEVNKSPSLDYDPTGTAMTYAEVESHVFPTTEGDLLKALFNVGYLPEDSTTLTARMTANSNAMMTTTSPVPRTNYKLRFITTIQQDPIRATRELFGQHFDEQVMQDHGYRVHTTEDLSSIAHIPMTPPPPMPINQYQAAPGYNAHLDLSVNQPIMNWDPVPEHDPFDISNPFALDQLLGISPMEVESCKSPSKHSRGTSNIISATNLASSPTWRNEDDFHFMF